LHRQPQGDDRNQQLGRQQTWSAGLLRQKPEAHTQNRKAS
jgi:hypothetical protein